MTSLANTEPSDKLECKLNILKVHYNCIHLNLDSNFYEISILIKNIVNMIHES